MREVQQIERYATLTGSQKLRTGWLKFLGSEIDTEVANQVTKGQAEKQAKENIHQQFKTHFQALLDSDNEIEAVYYTTGPIILSGCPYKKLTGRKRADLALTVSKLNRNIFTKYIKDKILPSQAGAILLDHRRKKEGQFSLYVDLTSENSEYKFYDFEGLSATHDKISLDTDVLSEGILSVKRQSQLSSTSSPSVPPIKADPPDSTKPAKIYFFLGAGNDEVVGYKEKRNIFDIGDGTKNFKGGDQSDTFIFRGNTPPPKPSVLDGVRGSNLLIANKKPSQGGYRVDLQAGYFSFTEGDDSKKIATLKNIHHIETCPETDDVIWGNDQTNILNGKGGEDKLIGFDGNDILVAQAGKMEGGKGTDCYRVLQNTHGEPATLIIKEEDDPEEFSHVFLDYSVEQIISIRRLKQNVLIELRNNNDSITTLTLSYLYFLSVERPQRRLTTQYIFYTQEGVIFSGLPSEIAFNFNEEEPEPLTLIAQYAQKFDQKFTPPEYESEKYPLIIQKMAYQKNRGVIDIRGEKKILPDFLRLVPQETGFDDDLQGNELNNTLHSKTGEDILEGKEGRDMYIIEDRPTGTQVSIYNYDEPETGEPEQDIVLVPFLLDDIEIKQEKDHVILSHLDSPTEHVTIRLMNFMRDESDRHLSIMDKEGRVHTVKLNSNHEPDLVVDQLFPDMTVNNGDNILSQLRQNMTELSEVEKVFHVSSDQISQTISQTMIPSVSS